MDQEMSTSLPGSGKQMPPDAEHPQMPVATTSKAPRVQALQGFIFDIFVECSPEDGSHPNLEGIRMMIFGSNNDNSGDLLEKSSQTTWDYCGVVELCTDMSGLTFVIQSEEGDEVGRVLLNKEELIDAHMASSTSLQEVEHQFVTEVGSPSLLLNFMILGMRQDRETLLSLPLMDSSLDEKEVMVHLSEEAGTLAEVCNAIGYPQEELLDAYGVVFMGRFERTGDLNDLAKAIDYQERAVVLTPETHADMPSRLIDLGMSFSDRFERMDNLDDLGKAIDYQERAVALTSESHADMPSRLINLGRSFYDRFQRTGRLDDLSKTIEYEHRAVALTPESDAKMPSRLVNLGISFSDRFKHKGDLDDISKAIEYLHCAVALTPEGHANMHSRLSLLGMSFCRRFERIGTLDDLSKAIEYLQHAIALTPEGHTDMPSRRNSLGDSFSRRFERMGNLDDLLKAIEYQHYAVTLTPEGHADMPSWLNNLGSLFCRLFEQKGNFDDLSKAIEYYHRAIALTPNDHTTMPTLLSNLGNSFRHRFERTGNADDLLEAIEYQHRAVALTPEGHTEMPLWLSNLGLSFSHLFEQTGDLDDLSKATEYQHRAISLTPNDHTIMPKLLNNHGMSFVRRFERLGKTDDLLKAIDYQRRAVVLTPEGHVDMPSWLNNLGFSFSCRFEQTGDLHDLSKAIEYQHRAISLTPKDQATTPTLLNNLSISFTRRFDRTANFDDLLKAIEYQHRAVALTPEGHANMPSRRHSLGALFSRCFERTGNIDDLSKAIEHQHCALALTPEGHTDMPSGLNNLGLSFACRFEKTGNPDDLSKALEHQHRAVALAPKGHANLPTLRNGYGELLMLRFEHTSILEDCETANLNFRLAAAQLSGPPSIRLEAAGHWAYSSLRLDDMVQTLQAYTSAIELLSLVAGLDQTILNRHNNLVHNSSLTSEAVVFAIAQEDSNTALEWLEQGRCLVWTQLNQLRTPVNKLSEHDSQLADQFLTVSKALESSGSRSGDSSARKMEFTHQMKLEDQARTHLKLAQEWDQLLARIRRIPDFLDFLRPRKANTILSQLPPDGPIVIINVHPVHCDALILVHGADEVLRIPLNNITYKKLEKLRRDLRNYLASKRLLMRDDRAGGPSPRHKATNLDTLRNLLRVLWKGVVRPILGALGYSSAPPRRNRIWWCPTGPLSFLPLHAAGIYGSADKAPGSCLSDYAISSYIPTVNTLLEKLTQSAKASQSDTKILLVSQQNTPGLPPITGTTTETQAILDEMAANDLSAVRLEDDKATTQRVREGLQSHQWVHLACHASQHPTDPLKSAFYLHNGQLELMDIIRQDLPAAEFAFLSACQTSVGDEKLSDEAVHLAAGMLAAGYQGVVGTMWSIGDGCAPKIAEEFYAHLLKERRDSGSQRLDSSRAAHALDHAIHKIRRELPDDEHSLLTWVPYAHYGL